jgi:hypothetical protein
MTGTVVLAEARTAAGEKPRRQWSAVRLPVSFTLWDPGLRQGDGI